MDPLGFFGASPIPESEFRAELARQSAILEQANAVIRAATAIADTIDDSSLSEKDRWLVDHLRSVLEDLRAVP